MTDLAISPSSSDLSTPSIGRSPKPPSDHTGVSPPEFFSQMLNQLSPFLERPDPVTYEEDDSGNIIVKFKLKGWDCLFTYSTRDIPDASSLARAFNTDMVRLALEEQLGEMGIELCTMSQDSIHLKYRGIQVNVPLTNSFLENGKFQVDLLIEQFIIIWNEKNKSVALACEGYLTPANLSSCNPICSLPLWFEGNLYLLNENVKENGWLSC